ncbi:facilitated trehalose transporter Tret1-like [Sitodiplosis mosellana]|uniref:facilitated trehalose transporter Tret1-like n=1 Tax=Sitodiplosis mosellana TaxID=263140 RepID=UPI0024449CA0|nr:facilitated trehalose transporter Tret1-like [Sitodiplosis mosellana]
MIERNTKIEWEPSAKNQYLAVFTINFLGLACGMGLGWTSPSILVLTSDESPLPSGKITMEEASWITSLWSVGGLIGCMTFGFITSHFGRKWPLIFMIIPKTISWLLVLFAQNVYYLYISRIIFGIAVGGATMIVPLFVSEIANKRIRGALGATQILTVNFGTLLAFILGNSFDYYTTPTFLLILLFIFAISFAFFPESPTVLVRQNRIAEAEKSIKFYQSLREGDNQRLRLEINQLKSSLCLLTTEKCDENSFDWADLLTNPGRKALMIGATLAMLIKLNGSTTMLSYGAKIFKALGSAVSPNVSVIVVGVAQLLGTFVTINLVDRAGRRFLYIASTIGTALGLVTLGAFMVLKSWQYDVEFFNWIPIVSFSFIAFMASWALLGLPFVVISEIMPEKLKDFGATICQTLKWSLGFLIPKYFPILINLLGFHGTMFLFAFACLFGTVFVIVFLPETKGKSRDQITNLLR